MHVSKGYAHYQVCKLRRMQGIGPPPEYSPGISAGMDALVVDPASFYGQEVLVLVLLDELVSERGEYSEEILLKQVPRRHR